MDGQDTVKEKHLQDVHGLLCLDACLMLVNFVKMCFCYGETQAARGGEQDL